RPRASRLSVPAPPPPSPRGRAALPPDLRPRRVPASRSGPRGNALARLDRPPHRRGRDRGVRRLLDGNRSPARHRTRPCPPAGGRMTEALLISTIVLWVAVIALAGLVVALPRQIGVLYE